MITEIYFQGTSFSKLQYPNKSGIMDRLIDCNGKDNKVKNILMIEINASFKMEDFESKKLFNVFSAKSNYTLITDGSLNIQDLYKVFHDAMQIMLRGLNEIETKNNLHQTQGLRPASLQSLRPLLQNIVDRFHEE